MNDSTSTQWTYDFAVIGLGYVGLPLAMEATLSGGSRASAWMCRQRPSMPSTTATARSTTSATETVAMRSQVASSPPQTLPSGSGTDDPHLCSHPAQRRGRTRPGRRARQRRDDLPGPCPGTRSSFWSRPRGRGRPRRSWHLCSPSTASRSERTSISVSRRSGSTPATRPTACVTPPRSSRASPPRAATARPSSTAQFIDDVVVASGTREAEMAKLLENTYRQINIALVNEMAKFSHDLDIDIWEVIRCASTKPFGFAPFWPGAGVGGHCIPIDPSYLSHRVQSRLGYPFRFVELAQEINRSMPRYLAQRAQSLLNDRERPVKGSRIGILGVTYKPGIADQRRVSSGPVGRRADPVGCRPPLLRPLRPTVAAGDQAAGCGQLP